MICLTDDGLWIGNSADGKSLGSLQVGAVLNVAHDLRVATGWPAVEYMQVGLVDGPGNHPSVYCAAVLALTSLMRRHKTLVCCHTGGRSLAVIIMYLELINPRGWDNWLQSLNEKVGVDLPVVHPAHQFAFEGMNWRSLKKLVGSTT